MDTVENLVPKVHPATRAVEADDPMTIVANPVAGDPDEMLACIVQEFAWMGWDADQLLALFKSPFYPVLNQFHSALGEAALRRRIEALLSNTGILRFRAVVQDEPETEEPNHHEPEFVELTVPAHWQQWESKQSAAADAAATALSAERG